MVIAYDLPEVIDVLGERGRICPAWGVEGLDLSVWPPQKPVIYAIRSGVISRDLAFQVNGRRLSAN